MMTRPAFKFRGFVGHRRVVDPLRRQLAGAKARAEPFPATLLRGPSGVGKTLLARVLAEEYGSELHVILGTGAPEDVARVHDNCKASDFILVDEAHRLVPKVQELLYQLIDNGHLPDMDAKAGSKSGEQNGRSKKPKLITVLLATDQPGRLLDALQKRMELVVALDFYPLPEMKEIVDRLATDAGVLISSQAAMLIAKASGGVPRRARHHLRNLRRYYPDAGKRQISIGETREFLRRSGIDGHGLDRSHRKYLRFLKTTRKASLESLAICLGCDCEYVRRQIEPLLQRNRLIVIRSGGRQLTKRGKSWVYRQRKKTTKGANA